MSDHEILSTIPASALAAVPVPQLSRERPWAARARELEPTEGMWCDYAAWREWINDRMDKAVPGGCDFLDILSEGDGTLGLVDIHLYCLMCGRADGEASL